MKRHLFLIALVLFATSMQVAESQERKRTPALREQVYSQLARAQELADAGDVPAGIAALQNVETKISSMNSYERAMLWNFYGYMYYGQDNIERAIHYFSKVVDEDPIPESLQQNTLFSLAQLALGESRYDDTLAFLDRWQALVGDAEQTKALVLKAQALYQQESYAEALAPITAAIEKVEAEGNYGDENWYVLQRAIHFELGNTEAVADVLATMVKAFNKPEYWIQLAGVYGQLGQEAKQLALLEAAYQQGFLTKGSDLMNLAQSYFFSDVPYKAGKVLERGLEEGKIERNLRNLKMLAQSWVAARETDKAVAALEAAAELSEDGELDAQRAQVLINAERNQEAIRAARRALEKGGLEQPGNMHLVIGMAELNLENFNEALRAFAQAKQFDDVRRTANQWERYTSSEKEQRDRLTELRKSSS